MNNYKSINEQLFYFIWKIFKINNLEANNLQKLDGSKIIINFKGIIGLNCLWLIILESEDAKV